MKFFGKIIIILIIVAIGYFAVTRGLLDKEYKETRTFFNYDQDTWQEGFYRLNNAKMVLYRSGRKDWWAWDELDYRWYKYTARDTKYIVQNSDYIGYEAAGYFWDGIPE